MGWLREGSALQNFWERMPERQGGGTPSACAHSLGKLALTEAELRAINVPVEIIVGNRDRLSDSMSSLSSVRKDWPVVEIKDAGHLNCIIKPQFKTLFRRGSRSIVEIGRRIGTEARERCESSKIAASKTQRSTQCRG